MSINLMLNKAQSMKSQGIQDVIIMGTAKSSSMIIGLAFQSLLAWMLGPASRGEFAICMIFTTITASIFSFSLESSTSYYIASKRIPAGKVINNSLFYALFISALLPVFLSPLIHSDYEFFKKASIEVFSVSVYWAASLLIFNILCGCLRGLRLFKLLAMINISKLLITLIATGYMLHEKELAVLAPIYANLGSNILISSLVIVYLFAIKLWVFELPELKPAKQLAFYGLRMFGGSTGMVINLQLITILLAFYVSSVEIGYFALAMALLTQIGTLSDVLNSVLLPRISSSKSGRSKLVEHSTALTSICILSASIMLLLIAESIIPTLFSDAFIPTIELLWILAPGMWLRAAAKTLFSYFSGTNNPQIITINIAINITTNVMLFFALTPTFGLPGAAMASTIANTLSFIHIALVFRSNTNINPASTLFPLTAFQHLYFRK